MGAEFFFLLLRDSRAKGGDNNIQSTPYPVIYGGGVDLAVQLVRIRKLISA